jgi:hypothetical protein
VKSVRVTAASRHRLFCARAVITCLFALLYAVPAAAQDGGAGGAGDGIPDAGIAPDSGDLVENEDIHAPELLEFVETEYPPAALEARMEGAVVLRLGIDAEGHVTEAEVMQSAGSGFD